MGFACWADWCVLHSAILRFHKKKKEVAPGHRWLVGHSRLNHRKAKMQTEKCPLILVKISHRMRRHALCVLRQKPTRIVHGENETKTKQSRFICGKQTFVQTEMNIAASSPCNDVNVKKYGCCGTMQVDVRERETTKTFENIENLSDYPLLLLLLSDSQSAEADDDMIWRKFSTWMLYGTIEWAHW